MIAPFALKYMVTAFSGDGLHRMEQPGKVLLRAGRSLLLADHDAEGAARAQMLSCFLKQAVNRFLAGADGRVQRDQVKGTFQAFKTVAENSFSPDAVLLRVAPGKRERAGIDIRHRHPGLRPSGTRQHAHRPPAAAQIKQAAREAFRQGVQQNGGASIQLAL